MLIICFALWSLASIMTPSDASNTLAIITMRVCVGVAQGFLIPSVHTVLSQVCAPCLVMARACMLACSMQLAFCSVALIGCI